MMRLHCLSGPQGWLPRPAVGEARGAHVDDMEQAAVPCMGTVRDAGTMAHSTPQADSRSSRLGIHSAQAVLLHLQDTSLGSGKA